MRILAVMGLLMVMLSGCGGSATDQVHIRIRNASGQDFATFFLGAGGTSGAEATYGAINSGETTSYQAFGTAMKYYGKSNFTTKDGKQHLHTTYTDPAFGTNELAPGYYTFSYDLANDDVKFTFAKDK